MLFVFVDVSSLNGDSDSPVSTDEHGHLAACDVVDQAEHHGDELRLELVSVLVVNLENAAGG